MSELPILLAPINVVDFAISVSPYVHIHPEPRHRCPTCLLRRVVYRVEIIGGPIKAMTGAQCASCWGLR